MGGYFNIIPLQLQPPSSSHPSLMLTGRVPNPQGSGTSSRPEPLMGMPASSGQLENPLKGSSPNTSAATSTSPQPPAINVYILPTETSFIEVA